MRRGLLTLITTLASCWAADDCLFTAVDLTQEFAPSTNYYPDFYPFEVSLENAISETFANASKYVAGDEGGTKVEVPARFKEDGFTIGQLFKDRLLFLQACVIDLAEKTALNDNYQASIQDVEEWQYIFGAIPPRSIIIFDFGWSPRYQDGDRYFGKRDTLNHPGISPELADYLGRHGSVVAVGTDAPDVDCGRNNELSTSPSQRVLAAHNKYTVTQLALGRHRLPAVGAVITVAPFYMADATAAPARVFAEFCADPEPEIVDPNPPPPPPPQIQYVYVAVPTPAPAPASTPAASTTQKQAPVASVPSQGQPSYSTTPSASSKPASQVNNNQQYVLVNSPNSPNSQGYAIQNGAASSNAPSPTYQYVLSQPSSGSQDRNPSISKPAATSSPNPSSQAASPLSLTAAQYLQLAALLAQDQQQSTPLPTTPSPSSPYLNLLSSLGAAPPLALPQRPLLPPSPPRERPPHQLPSQPSLPSRPRISPSAHVNHDFNSPKPGPGYNKRPGHPRPKQPKHLR